MSRKRVGGSKQARRPTGPATSGKRMPVTVRDPLSRRVVKQRSKPSP